jgi:hypothetical protein
MNIEEAILFNQFGQELCDEEKLMAFFLSRNSTYKRALLKDLVHLIIQSKVTDEDVSSALKKSNLKSTYTPCVLIQKGLNYETYQKIISLPEPELWKSFKLFIHLFKVGYLRRYKKEKNDPNKWWYWDLSQENNLKYIKRCYNS